MQYTFARINSILKKTGTNITTVLPQAALLPLEKSLLLLLEQYGAAIEQAAIEHNPSVIANYVFLVAKSFNSFYTDHSINNAETEEKKQLRVMIAIMVKNVLHSGMQMLGITMPERM